MLTVFMFLIALFLIFCASCTSVFCSVTDNTATWSYCLEPFTLIPSVPLTKHVVRELLVQSSSAVSAGKQLFAM